MTLNTIENGAFVHVQDRLFMSLLFLLLFHLAPIGEPELKLVMTDIREAKGRIYVAVYDSPNNYMSYDQSKIRARRVLDVRTNGSMSCAFPELPPGSYAITCFHDINSNGELDTNLFGIPSEPYGVSNNVRPKFRAARWDEARFEWKKDGAPLTIRLEKW